MSPTLPRRLAAAVAAATLSVAVLAGCAGGSGSTGPIRLGWSGTLPPLDPAASDSAGSFAFLSQIYPSLLAVRSGEDEPIPSIAASAEWTEPGIFEVVLKTGLEFANGDALTSSDVKFSIERQLALQSEDGAWRRLSGIDSVEIVDDTTVRFRVATDVDSRLPFVLAGPAGLVLDEEVFYADELTPDEEIIDAEPFAGPFSLAARRDETFVLTPYGSYGGLRAALSTVEVQPADPDTVAQRLRDGALDVTTGRFDVATVAELSEDDEIDMTRAASGRVRLLAFDFAHMPFGTRTEAPDAAKALAVRAAIADLIDREALVDGIGADWLEPLTGYLPTGVPGSADVFSESRGDAEGGPDADRAEAGLVAAGIVEPLDLTLHVDLDQVGDPGSAEVAALAEQLDDSGLFSVTVVETDADGLGAALIAGEVQAMFTSVLPADSDPQGYLSIFRSTSVAIPGYADATVDGLLAALVTEPDADVREDALVGAQQAIAAQLPAIPVTQGVRVVFARQVISGTALDDSLSLDLTRLRR